MRNIILFISVCLFIGCSKKSTNTANLPAADNSLSFKANGQNYSYTGTFAWSYPNGVFLGKFIESDSTFKIELLAGNITLDQKGLPVLNTKVYLENTSSYYTDENHKYYFDTTQSYIVFSKYDSIAAGTFQCYGTNDLGQTINITSGNFYVIHF